MSNPKRLTLYFGILLGLATLGQFLVPSSLPPIQAQISQGNRASTAAITAGINAAFASPPALGYGSTTPEPVAATTITASTSLSTGASPPAIAGSPTGGGLGCTEGTGPTAAASADFLYCNSTLHDWATNANGGVNRLVVSSIGYNSGSISGSVGATNIASAANFPTGQYELNCDVIITAVGSSPTLNVTIGWTDISGTARTKACFNTTATITDNPTTQTITSNGSAVITVTQTLAVSTATWQTMIGLTRLQ